MEMRYFNGTFYCVTKYTEKDIPKGAGFKWNPALKRWETQSFSNAKKLIDYADKEARDVIEAKEKEEIETIKASMKKESDIQIPCPQGLKYFPFQLAGAEFALKRKHTLIADEMGLGKTIQAIAVLNATDWEKVLIVCPAFLKINWQRELEKWLVKKDIKICIDNTGGDVIITNYERLHKEQLSGIVFDTVIFDESHYIKNPNAQRTKEAMKIQSKKYIFLTGTPILNKPQDLYPILKIAGSHLVERGYYPFIFKWCGARKTRWGIEFGYIPEKTREALQEELRKSIMIRRMKADVMAELPDKTRQVIEINNISGDIKKLIKEELEIFKNAKKDFEKEKSKLKKQELADEEYKTQVAKLRVQYFGNMQLLQKLKHSIGLAKVDYTMPLILNTIEEKPCVVVFTYHIDVANLICENLQKEGIEYVTITGEDSVEERQAAVDRFQNDASVKVAVCTIKAAGVGITLTRADTAIFVENDWSPANMLQAEDRIHRIGQKSNVNIFYVVFNESVDAYIIKKNMLKQEIQDDILNYTEEDLQTLGMA